VASDQIDGRLVFVAQTYSPAIDGTAVLIRHLAERFAADGEEVHVITSDALGPAGFRTRRAERAHAPAVEEIGGVQVHRLGTFWWLSSLSRPVQAMATRVRLPRAESVGDVYLGPVMRGLRETLDDLRPSAVYASAFPYWHMHQLAAWGQRRHLPVVLHGALHPEDTWAFDRSSIRKSCLRAAGYAANSAYEARYVEGLGVPRDRITVVGAGVDPNALVARPAQSEAASGHRPRVLYFGHLSARKGLDTVVEALPTIWARHPTIEVVIAGKTTDEADALRRAAFELSEGHDLRWRPDVSEEEKGALLASSSLVVYPSRAESFGIVFLEAWTFGVPVVGCRAGAVPDVVEDGVTGLLIPPGDSIALADCVTRLLADPTEAVRLGNEGRRRLLEHHTWSAVVLRARQALAAACESEPIRKTAL
jgi:glycosyltransferase involved in cell wall biosynthesis